MSSRRLPAGGHVTIGQPASAVSAIYDDDNRPAVVTVDVPFTVTVVTPAVAVVPPVVSVMMPVAPAVRVVAAVPVVAIGRARNRGKQKDGQEKQAKRHRAPRA